MKSKLIDHILQHVSLSEEERALLLSKVSERDYLKGQYISQNGDISSSLNFITEGAVKVFYIDRTGKEHIMMLGVENWWAADLSSIVTQTPAAYSIQCTEATKVLKISRIDHYYLLEKLPVMNKYFRIITENAYAATQERIIQNFAFTAKERYLRFSNKYPEHLNRFPQYMVASYLGITKEFLSKIRGQKL